MANNKLTTHVLDTMHGIPAQQMRLQLVALQGELVRHIAFCSTNADGRADCSLMQTEDTCHGEYELRFHVGRYFDALGVKVHAPFLDVVPIRFTISEDKHYHVPLLVSPFAYSTYRGS